MSRSPGALLARSVLPALIAAVLLAAVAGGLQRSGFALGTGAVAGAALLQHAALMLSSLLGTVIAVERAVALKRRWAFIAPWASAVGGVALLAGLPVAGAWAGALAAAVFVAASVAVLARQVVLHAGVLLLGAIAWLVGNLLFALGAATVLVLPWWFAFIVLTVAAERLEMARLMRHPPAVQFALVAILSALLAGAALTGRWPVVAGALFGGGLSALALWLLAFDVARRTLHGHGLARYMAVSLLAGYAWLAVAGVAWVGEAFGCPGRDWALHALGLGFIFSMVMGHAPVILPAVARTRLWFGLWFHAPLLLLHVSLLVRLPGSLVDPSWRQLGALLNAAAVGLFVVTLLASALAWRLKSARTLPSRTRPE
jgi:hypothetical protein